MSDIAPRPEWTADDWLIYADLLEERMDPLANQVRWGAERTKKLPWSYEYRYRGGGGDIGGNGDGVGGRRVGGVSIGYGSVGGGL